MGLKGIVAEDEMTPRDTGAAMGSVATPHPNPSPEGEGLKKAHKLLGIALEGSVG